MERVAEPPRPESSSCVSCGGSLFEERRCSHCGATSRAGRFTVERVIAQGPFGRVYLAHDDAGREVALKELVYNVVPSTHELDAFERESRLMAELSHPRIPAFVDGFTEGRGVGTRLYLARQFVAGEPLSARLERGPLSEDEAFDVALQVLDILDWLHTRSPPLVHRDVKPANLIVAPGGDIHLVDFGTARLVAGAQTYRSTLVGTIGYMAPEQLGGTVGPRSDLYSLGATLVHALSGKAPEPGEFGVVDTSRLAVSVRMSRFLAGLLAPKAEDRYASAREALKGLNDPSRARPRTRTGQRSRLLLAAGAGLLVAAMAALTGAVVLTPRADPVAVRVATPSAAGAGAVSPQPEQTEKAVAPAEDDQPPVGRKTPFEWQLAAWEFKDSTWAVDTTGHRHSGRLPRGAFTLGFFGPEFTGKGGVLVRDAPELAPATAFTIQAMVMRAEGLPGKQKVEHLITRGSLTGLAAYDFAFEGDQVRFTIADEQGQRSTIQGPARMDDHSATTYFAEFDPETGDQWIFRLSSCKPLAHTVTRVRPARTVAEPVVHLIDGFRGNVTHIELSRGLNLPTPGQTGESCGYSGSKLTGE